VTSTSRGGPLLRFTRTQTEVDADRLESDSEAHGHSHIRDCAGGCTVTVGGRLRSVTLRPVANAPAVEAELWDGTGRLTLLFLGRRRIPGIAPGRHVVVHGRAIVRDGERTMVNPRYELLPSSSSE
jgi:RecG-like helicase